MQNDIYKQIQRIAARSVQAEKPVEVIIGEITKLNPLTIKFDDNRELDEDFLTLTRTIKNRMEEYKSAGKSVIAIRCQGGQEYVVIDEVAG
nr:MAG TPA: Protein of unknown function (DUF2577) [Caudoviricetes sp.]